MDGLSLCDVLVILWPRPENEGRRVCYGCVLWALGTSRYIHVGIAFKRLQKFDLQCVNTYRNISSMTQNYFEDRVLDSIG